MIIQSWVKIYLNITTRKDGRSESELAFPKAQRSLEQATDNMHQKNIVALAGKQAGSLTTGFRLSIASLISSLLATSGRQLVKIFVLNFKYFTDISPIFWQLLKQK
jgi:hypothetical protein